MNDLTLFIGGLIAFGLLCWALLKFVNWLELAIIEEDLEQSGHNYAK